MPSSQSKKPANQSATSLPHGRLLFPLMALTLILWVLYRSLFNFSVLFDESIGKAVFFALPVVFYLAITNDKKVLASFAGRKIKSGLLLGIAVGGLFGFVFALLAFLRQKLDFSAPAAYLQPWFWRELTLALLTSFWETLFFFSFFFTVLMNNYRRWSLAKQVLVAAFVFLLFHLPNIFLKFTLKQVLVQALLLFAFALGQALFFSQRRNAYAAILIQAIWGMVLLVYF